MYSSFEVSLNLCVAVKHSCCWSSQTNVNFLLSLRVSPPLLPLADEGEKVPITGLSKSYLTFQDSAQIAFINISFISYASYIPPTLRINGKIYIFDFSFLKNHTLLQNLITTNNLKSSCTFKKLFY